MNSIALLVVLAVAAFIAYMIWKRRQRIRRHAAFAAAQGWKFSTDNPHGIEDGEQYFTVSGGQGHGAWRIWYGLIDDPAFYRLVWEALDGPNDDAQRFRLCPVDAGEHFLRPYASASVEELEELKERDTETRRIIEREQGMHPAALHDPVLDQRFLLEAAAPEFVARLLTPDARAFLAKFAPDSFCLFLDREKSESPGLTMILEVPRNELWPNLRRLADLGEVLLGA